ncbi:MAG: non-canonical purine NTP pyrophosphatase, RdgB/HAM1 family [SAR202 cluster bacterium Io17-Chloro-G2]|nr:MAG: non-canonical purine NTP pyrophosphatase, RdgB/HAM1 family [SAR202 cluster bacterium Io17-Chloro-G2]
MSLPKLLIATRNPGKMREYGELLRDLPFELVSLDNAGVAEEVEETGQTFHENAALKAVTYASLAGMMALADDSGLEVDALGGEPGVHSARYGAKAPWGDEIQPMSDQDRVMLLLENLKDIPWEKRIARFRCVICIARPAKDGGFEAAGSVVGAVAGMIQYQPQGEDGFGYDPVFYLPSYGLTMAQISLEEKNRISHRADAAGRATTLMKQIG